MASISLCINFFITLIINSFSVNGLTVNDNELSKLFAPNGWNPLWRESDGEKNSVHPQEVPGWPVSQLNVGQITGVAVDLNHQPVIFHRGPRVWDETTFDKETHRCRFKSEDPIKVDTLLTLDPATGEITGRWGNNFFYLPHGLTIDNYGYYYMTDVCLHQAFKFKPGSKTPLLTFGQRFEPGSGIHHLCKPTDVAVATTGEIFIADGYCNSRILEYDSDGNLLYILPMNQDYLPLNVPHSITLLQELDLICIADRENMRVVCPKAGLRGLPRENAPVLRIQQPDMGRIFAVTSYGNTIYAVNGPSMPMVQIKGMTIDPILEAVVDQWTPAEEFQNPHDVEVCHNTSSIYVVEINPNRIWKFQLRSPIEIRAKSKNQVAQVGMSKPKVGLKSAVYSTTLALNRSSFPMKFSVKNN